MGALARMCYRHMDQKNLTDADLIGILSRFPFTAYEDENKTAHRNLYEEWTNSNSVLHRSNIEPSALAALGKIRNYSGDAVILSLETKLALDKLQL